MSTGTPRFQDYDLDEAKNFAAFITNNPGTAKQFIRETTDRDALAHLVTEERLDRQFGRGPGSVREKLLESDVTPFEIKQTIFARGRDELSDVRVPDRVRKNARTALAVGKPVVLYGPTGTGKTYFAKQLLAEQCVNYSVHTATPTWTPGDITGSIEPRTENGEVTYHREPGCVSRGIQKAEQYGEAWGVVIDEITRADISQVFGPLYTAVEDDSQVIFRSESGEELTLTDDVKIVCTMNMSDRTVNELDDAITRRFAMIELNRYDEASRLELYRDWMADESIFERPDTARRAGEATGNADAQQLSRLFERHHAGVNDGATTTGDDGITEFGPMHYRDVIGFLGVAVDGGEYDDDLQAATGEAFATYIVPRLLNTAALPQIQRLREHYETLHEEFPQFDLTPAIDLVERQEDAERRGIASGAYE